MYKYFQEKLIESVVLFNFCILSLRFETRSADLII